MEIRDLIVNDVFAAGRILGKTTRAAQVQLLAALMGKAGRGHAGSIQLFMAVLQGLMLEADAEVKAWMASLAGLATEEYGEKPAMMVFDVAEALMAKEDAQAFFAKVSSLFSSREA